MYERIPEIIAHPEYIGCHPNGLSLKYIKRIDGNVLVAVRLCDIIWVRNNDEGGRGSCRTFGSERDAGLSPCRCLSNKESPFGDFLYFV
nr:hypothetical protein [Streptococcus thermophilus]